MPNRILYEKVCSSETLALLTSEEERFFYRLMVQCDDYGRFDARPMVLRARCFSLQLDAISDADVAAWLCALERVGLVVLYAHEARPYLEMATWGDYQQTRAKRSKYPDPRECAPVCEQMRADVDIGARIRYPESLNENRYPESLPDTTARGASAGATITTAASDESPRAMVAGYLSLSEPARQVVDDWRAQQGRKRPPRLNPAQCAEIELAVADLGVPALLEANVWAARNEVPEIVKAIRAARTKRQRDEENGCAASERTDHHPDAAGGAPGETLAPPSEADAALWSGAQSDLADEMSGANWETYIAPLAVAGRRADGGLCLRAPPLLTAQQLQRFRPLMTRALSEAGDPAPSRFVIVEAAHADA